jgi:hypothetical protein
LEIAMKVKGSQGKPHIEWLKQEHPCTAISPKSDVHANHNEAQNSSLRRRASEYRRKQNLDAKAVVGLQRVLNMQRMIHNWVRPDWGLRKQETPVMAIGYIVGGASLRRQTLLFETLRERVGTALPLALRNENRPIAMLELLSTRGFQYVTL